MPSFFAQDLALDSTTIQLDDDEARHALKVRRLKDGDQVSLINGDGLRATGTLKVGAQGAALVEVLLNQVVRVEQTSHRLIVASALPKGDRTRFLIEMLTQLGVWQFIPLECDRSVQKASTSLLNKIRRYAIEACKQSDNPWLPFIHSPVRVSALRNTLSAHHNGSHQEVGLLYCDATGDGLPAAFEKAGDACAVIGPEGGFSSKELALLEQQGGKPISLAPWILRTETAGAAVAAQWQMLASQN